MQNKEKAFWITNISNRNVTLSDLYISVQSMTSINLLDKSHYNFTEEQVVKSATSGSIFIKRDKIVVRKIAPPITKERQLEIDHNAYINSRSKSIYEIKQERYEELEISDEEIIESATKLIPTK